MNYITTDWLAQLKQAIQEAATIGDTQESFTRANINAVKSIIAGYGPDANTADPEAGARMVVNIAAVHVPGFCAASRREEMKPYKNGYDLETYHIGESAPNNKLKKRELVDSALPLDSNITADNVYFGAVELNGCGIRFYGDVCLVLKTNAIPENTVVLDRNSYDLIRAPIRDRINAALPQNQAQARKCEAWKLRGSWENDLGAMAAIKVLDTLGERTRRFTTEQVSEALRNDEDYMEVLKVNSFRTDDLQEARLTPTDAAHDALTGDRLHKRPTPRLEALMSRFRRRVAENALRHEGVVVRVVTTSSRTKD